MTRVLTRRRMIARMIGAAGLLAMAPLACRAAGRPGAIRLRGTRIRIPTRPLDAGRITEGRLLAG